MSSCPFPFTTVKPSRLSSKPNSCTRSIGFAYPAIKLFKAQPGRLLTITGPFYCLRLSSHRDVQTLSSHQNGAQPDRLLTVIGPFNCLRLPSHRDVQTLSSHQNGAQPGRLLTITGPFNCFRPLSQRDIQTLSSHQNGAQPRNIINKTPGIGLGLTHWNELDRVGPS